MSIEAKRMQQLRGIPADYATNDVVPLQGEIAVLYDGSRTRLKVGDGVNAFSVLGWVGEQDETARAAAAAVEQTAINLDTRLKTVEPVPNAVAALTQQVQANTQSLNTKQPKLPDGIAVGDLLLWDGIAWTTFEIGPAQNALLYFDAAQGRWVALPRGPAGSVLTVSPIGRPAWQAAAAVSITTLPLTGGADVAGAFNAQKPTVAVGELLVVTFNGTAYLYTGHPGSGITTATTGDFTQLGAGVGFAAQADLTTPAGGATNLAVSPALLNAWAQSADFDAGTY
jgi:hypothetical protein